MKFQDLKLGKTKRLSLYKAFLLGPLEENSPPRTIPFNMDIERYGLTETAAFELAVNNYPDKTSKEVLDMIFNNDLLVIILKINLIADCMKEKILLENGDPNYDKERGYLTATVRGRFSNSDISLHNYTIDNDINFDMDNGGNIFFDEIKFTPLIINEAVTGKV